MRDDPRRVQLAVVTGERNAGNQRSRDRRDRRLLFAFQLEAEETETDGRYSSET